MSEMRRRYYLRNFLCSVEWCALGNLEQYRKWVDRMLEAVLIKAMDETSLEEVKNLARWRESKNNPHIQRLWGRMAFLTRK